MRISTTTLESFRLFMQPEQEWMPESDLIDTIKGVWKPNHRVLLGQAFGAVLECPEKYRVKGGYRVTTRDGEETFEFCEDAMEPCLAVFDRRGAFEVKQTKDYAGHTVVAKADQLFGARVIENKATLSTFDFDKYAESYQWRFYADIFAPACITYNVFCLSEATNGVIELREIQTFNFFPYAALHADCLELARQFVEYVNVRGLAPYLERGWVAA